MPDNKYNRTKQTFKKVTETFLYGERRHLWRGDTGEKPERIITLREKFMQRSEERVLQAEGREKLCSETKLALKVLQS